MGSQGLQQPLAPRPAEQGPSIWGGRRWPVRKGKLPLILWRRPGQIPGQHIRPQLQDQDFVTHRAYNAPRSSSSLGESHFPCELGAECLPAQRYGLTVRLTVVELERLPLAAVIVMV